jgi:hypothetical protein
MVIADKTRSEYSGRTRYADCVGALLADRPVDYTAGDVSGSMVDARGTGSLRKIRYAVFERI